jgi:hypothetical protein
MASRWVLAEISSGRIALKYISIRREAEEMPALPRINQSNPGLSRNAKGRVKSLSNARLDFNRNSPNVD